MKDFFISYNRADRGWAEWIAWQLEGEGYEVVIQAWDFRPGCNFVLEMQKAAEGTRRTIAVLSKAYLEAFYTQPEWAAALKNDPTGQARALVPVCVGECDPGGILGAIARLELVGLERDVAREVLLDGVKLERAKPDEPPAFPGEAPGEAPSVALGMSTISLEKPPSFPGALPAVWNVPHRRNPSFTGRDGILEALQRGFASGKPVQAITGLGGVGKTQLAVEYASRHTADYRMVWWIRAEEPGTLFADLAALATPLDLPEKGSPDQPTIVDAVLRWLSGQRGWLLVFDSAIGPADLRDALPRGSTGHTIITSRSPAWGSLAECVSTDVLTRDESIEMLISRSGSDDREGAARLAEQLGDLPLALEQACAYVEETGTTFLDYSELFSSRRGDLWAEARPADYPETVATTWTLATEKAVQQEPASADLLSLLAYLGPEDIPRSILVDGIEHLPDGLRKTVADALLTNRAVAALRNYSLVETAGEMLSLHRLVQAVIRDRHGEEETKAWAAAAVKAVNEAFPFESDDVRTWETCSRLLSHGMAAARHAEERGVGLEAARRLENQVGVYLLARGDYAAARSAVEGAIRIDEAIHGPEHPGLSASINNLGMILKVTGDLEGARSCYERALRLDEQAHGPDDPQVARGLNNLGLLLEKMGELEAAKEQIGRALAINEQALGPDHPEVATCVSSLGHVLESMGDLDQARCLYERALAIDEASFGPEHPRVGIRVNNLGHVLESAGDLDSAVGRYGRAVRIFKAALGDDHKWTQKAIENFQRIEERLGTGA
jgi:tetratricopeptide (TPR) repeat protein